MHRRAVAVLLTAAIVAASCAGGAASADPSPTPGPISLNGTSWVAVSITDTNTVPNAMPTLVFEEDRVSGSTGCNSFGGTVVVEAGSTVRFTDLVITEVACEDPVGAQEAALLAILGETVQLAFDEGMLFLIAPTGQVVFEGRAGGRE